MVSFGRQNYYRHPQYFRTLCISTLKAGALSGGRSMYDKLPIRMLAGFYYYDYQSIEDQILSDAMYHELNLIEQVATKKGFHLVSI